MKGQKISVSVATILTTLRQLTKSQYTELTFGQKCSGAEHCYGCFMLRHDTQYEDIQHNDIQHNDIQHNDIQHNDIQHNNIQRNDIQHNNIYNATLSINTNLFS